MRTIERHNKKNNKWLEDNPTFTRVKTKTNKQKIDNLLSSLDDPSGFLNNPENVAILGGGSRDTSLYEISGKLGHGTYSGSADFCRAAGIDSITFLNSDQS